MYTVIMATTPTPEQMAKLSVDERLKLIEIAWESLLAEGAEIPTPEWQRKLIRERVEEYRRTPDQGQDVFEFLDSLGPDE